MRLQYKTPPVQAWQKGVRRLIGQICIGGIPRSWHWLMRINWIKWDPEKCNPTKLFLFFDFVQMMNGNQVKVHQNT